MKKISVIHPFLFGLYPIFFLFTFNIDQLSLRVMLYPSIITLFLTAISWLLIRFILKNGVKAGLIVSLGLAVFFSFGHLYQLMVKIGLPDNLIRYRYTLSVYILLFSVFTYLIIKTKKDLVNFTRILNAIALILLSLSILKIGIYQIKIIPKIRETKQKASSIESFKKGSSPLPDIYYFILDGYANNQILKEIFNYDNSEFLNFLEKKGFYVVPEGLSNYIWTPLSIASSLNIEHLLYLSGSEGEQSSDLKILYLMIKNSKTANILKSMGYRFINFNSGWQTTDYNSNADVNIEYVGAMDEFAQLLARFTLLKILETKLFRKFSNYISRSKRARILNAFEKFPEHIKAKGPKFVLAHILSPHAPFVFGKNGEPVEGVLFDWSDWSQKDNYINEIIFLNKKMKELIDTIISSSPVPPVIIIQGDHGSAHTLSQDPYKWSPDTLTKSQFKEKTGILNAYLLSEKCKKALYDTITPVNSFRTIFNCYFDGEFELQPDEIFWSERYTPYKYTNITKTVREK